MYAEPFDYHRAGSVADAIELLASTPDAKPLAGGQGLIPAMKKRELTPGAIVDIGGLDELGGVTRGEESIRIGALTTHAEVLDSATLADSVPVVPAAVSNVTGGAQVHNVATIGGNLARAHPGYDYEGALLAAGASVELRGPDGERSVPVSAFVRGACETVLDHAELLTGIEVPTRDGDRRGGYAKRKEPASGNAIVGVASDIVVSPTDDTVESARVAVNGLQETAVRLAAVESALSGASLDAESIERAAAVAGESIDERAVLDNKKASAAYRLHLLERQVAESLSEAAR